MITWTSSARNELEDHLAQMHPGLYASGADPAEVTDDIRRHVDEELAASKVGVVTSADVGRILRRMGAHEAPRLHDTLAPRSRSPRELPPPEAPVPTPKSRHLTLFLLGVVLPVITLAVELVTHMCAATFFDPVPDFWHVLLVASVPTANFFAWHNLHKGTANTPRWLGAANGFALGVAAYYSLLYATLTPFALIGILYLGFGLLPLSPLLSFIVALRLRRLLRPGGPDATSNPVPGLGVGLAGAAVALALIALPIVATRFWSHEAVGDNPSGRHDAVKWLRRLGSERTLLADCYGNTRWANDGPLGFNLQGRPVNANDARNIYYRVTGRPFNSVAPPQLAFGSRAWSFIDDFAWDTEQGGQNVGGRLKGLSLAQSRIDGKVDADAGWSYVEWTLEFKNVFTMEREARAQIALPPGGVVSRLTLWVNGEEREAAFAGSGKVRAAYQQVVRVLRRDPVLVTMSGPDRVLMQCFPVPANGGTIKVRLGITAPVQLETAAAGWMRLPSFIERNFSIPEYAEHSLWLESRQPIQSGLSTLAVDRSQPGTNTLRGPLRDAALNDTASAVRLTRSPAASAAWVTDDRGAAGHIVRQNVAPRAAPRPDRVVFVVDGSRDMEAFFPAIADAIERLPSETEFALVLARDGVEQFTAGMGKSGRASANEPRPLTRPSGTLSPDGGEGWGEGDAPRSSGASHDQSSASSLQAIARRLRQTRAVGGQDNTLALLRGWDLASERTNSALVWLHGPQPFLLENGEALQQRFDWREWSGGTHGPAVLDFQVSPGPNRVLEKLNGLTVIKNLPRYGTVAEDLQRLTATWRGETQPLALVRERVEAGTISPEERGTESSRHLARLWAYDEIQRLIAARYQAEAVALAAEYQLVTPVSGAVVLESKEQFDRAGLTPVDPTSVPSVPEPGTIALFVLGAGLLALRLLWRRKVTPTPCSSATNRCG